MTNALYGQKVYYYTNGWSESTTNGAPVYTNSYWPELLQKIQYANNRWGCTLFYIDCYPVLDNDGPFSVGVLTNILQVYPNILLIPEVGGTYLEATKLFAMSAPYLVPSDTGYSVPTNVTPIYPSAVAVIKIDPPYTDNIALMKSIKGSNILMVNSWYPNSGVSAVQRAYLGATVQPPPNVHVATNSP